MRHRELSYTGLLEAEPERRYLFKRFTERVIIGDGEHRKPDGEEGKAQQECSFLRNTLQSENTWELYT